MTDEELTPEEERQRQVDAMRTEDAATIKSIDDSLTAWEGAKISERPKAAATEKEERDVRIDKGLDLDDAIEAGVRDPESDDIRESADLAHSMQHYNRQHIALVKLMQEIMIEGIGETDAIIARFHRVL